MSINQVGRVAVANKSTVGYTYWDGLQAEYELLRASIRLSTVRSKYSLSASQSKLSLQSIIDSLNELCQEFNVDEITKGRVYSAVLRMSSDVEKSSTWAEKLGKIDMYLKPKASTEEDYDRVYPWWNAFQPDISSIDVDVSTFEG